MVMQEYMDAGVKEWLPEFFESCLKAYAASLGATQNLYFHYAYSLHVLGNNSKSSEMAQKAKAAFKKNGALTPDIEKTLDSLIE